MITRQMPTKLVIETKLSLSLSTKSPLSTCVVFKKSRVRKQRSKVPLKDKDHVKSVKVTSDNMRQVEHIAIDNGRRVWLACTSQICGITRLPD